MRLEVALWEGLDQCKCKMISINIYVQYTEIICPVLTAWNLNSVTGENLQRTILYLFVVTLVYLE